MARPKLLYLTSAQSRRDLPALTEATSLVLGILSRDFEVSLAIVGAVSRSELNAIRSDLGITRVTGGFDWSPDDPSVDDRLKHLVGATNSKPTISARLLAAVQRRSGDSDSVVIDALEAAPYIPIGIPGHTVCFVQNLMSQSPELQGGLLKRRRRSQVREAELHYLQRMDRVFATSEMQSDLFALGLPLGKLVDQASLPQRGTPIPISSGFSGTRMRIGYYGYLADEANLASLRWFLENVWDTIRDTIPGLEFHIVGADSTAAVKQLAARFQDVTLHRDSKEHLLLELGCRVVVEPLLHENHIEAKLLNAMSRGIPVVTAREAVSRSHWVIDDAASVSDSPAHMVLSLKRLLSEATLWQAMSDRARKAAEQVEAYHEVAHSIRRYVLQSKQ